MGALLNEGMNRQLATNYIPDDGSYFSCSIAGIHTQFQQRRVFNSDGLRRTTKIMMSARKY